MLKSTKQANMSSKKNKKALRQSTLAIRKTRIHHYLDVIEMLDFLTDIFVTFEGLVFQQAISILIGINCVPRLIDMILH